MDFNEKFSDFSLDCKLFGDYLESKNEGTIFCIMSVPTRDNEEFQIAHILFGANEDLVYSMFSAAMESDRIKQLLLVVADVIKNSDKIMAHEQNKQSNA